MIPFWGMALIGIAWAAIILYLIIRFLPMKTRAKWVEWMKGDELVEVLEPIVDEIDRRIDGRIATLFAPKVDEMGREIPSDFVNHLVRSFKRNVAGEMGVAKRAMEKEAFEALGPEEQEMYQVNQMLDGLAQELFGFDIPPAIKMKLFSKLNGGGSKPTTFDDSELYKFGGFNL